MFYVMTWDGETNRFTPQDGVPHGPLTAFQLKEALRKLRNMGYTAHRTRSGKTPNFYAWNSDPCVLVVNEENYEPELTPWLTTSLLEETNGNEDHLRGSAAIPAGHDQRPSRRSSPFATVKPATSRQTVPW